MFRAKGLYILSISNFWLLFLLSLFSSMQVNQLLLITVLSKIGTFCLGTLLVFVYRISSSDCSSNSLNIYSGLVWIRLTSYFVNHALVFQWLYINLLLSKQRTWWTLFSVNSIGYTVPSIETTGYFTMCRIFLYDDVWFKKSSFIFLSIRIADS